MVTSEIEIVPVTAEGLRADHSGILIEQIARLAFECFREPPWHDDHAHARLHFGVGVDLMRRNALGLLAREPGSRQVLGYSVGYEVFAAVDDLRDLTLADIAGTAGLDGLFDAGGRLFYWDTLCVDRRYRRRKIAAGLAAAAMERLREWGFAHYVARTDRDAHAMRGLLSSMGFEELPVQDGRFIGRTYWLARL